MRTTLEVDERLIAEAIKLTGEKNKGKVVNRALAELVRRRKLEELRGMMGKLGLVDDWREREEAELEEMRRDGPGRHLSVD